MNFQIDQFQELKRKQFMYQKVPIISYISLFNFPLKQFKKRVHKFKKIKQKRKKIL